MKLLLFVISVFNSSFISETVDYFEFKYKTHIPVAWVEYVFKEANINNIDPCTVLAIISKESNFNPGAVSCVGARGLMQIMPFWCGSYSLSLYQLNDPYINIRTGINIFRKYLDIYKSESRALSAYFGMPHLKVSDYSKAVLSEKDSLLKIKSDLKIAIKYYLDTYLQHWFNNFYKVKSLFI